jgi:hypothetical protein
MLPGDENPLGTFHHEDTAIIPIFVDAPADGGMATDGGAAADGGRRSDSDPPNRRQRTRLVLAVLAGVTALCFGGAAIIGALVLSSTSGSKPAAITDGTAADSASPDPVQSDDPAQDRETGSPSASRAPRAAGLVAAPKPRARRAVTRSPSPSGTPTTTPTPSAHGSLVTAPPATTRPPSATGGPTTGGVEADAPCSPDGAIGLTSNGKLMQCQSGDGDPKLRWRPV